MTTPQPRAPGPSSQGAYRGGKVRNAKAINTAESVVEWAMRLIHG